MNKNDIINIEKYIINNNYNKNQFYEDYYIFKYMPNNIINKISTFKNLTDIFNDLENIDLKYVSIIGNGKNIKCNKIFKLINIYDCNEFKFIVKYEHDKNAKRIIKLNIKNIKMIRDKINSK